MFFEGIEGVCSLKGSWFSTLFFTSWLPWKGSSSHKIPTTMSCVGRYPSQRSKTPEAPEAVSQMPFPLIRCPSRVFTAAPSSPRNCFSWGSSAGHGKGSPWLSLVLSLIILGTVHFRITPAPHTHRGPSMWTSQGKRVCRQVEGFLLAAGPSLDGWWGYNEQIGELPHSVYSVNRLTLGCGFFSSPETLSKGLAHVPHPHCVFL